MFYQDFAQQPQSRSLPLLHAIAAGRHMALAACCLLIGSGCATLPDAAREMEVELGIGLRQAGYGVWQA